MADLATTNQLAAWAVMAQVTLPAGGQATALTYASREIRLYCGRAFEQSPTDGDADETRTFDGEGDATIVIDDLLEVTSVSLGGSAVAATGYALFGAQGVPYLYLARQVSQAIDTQAGSITVDKTGVWTLGNGNVSIVGLWGYAEDIPDDVVEACCKLAALKLSTATGWQSIGIKQTSALSVSVQYDAAAAQDRRKEILDSIRHYRRAEPEPNL